MAQTSQLPNLLSGYANTPSWQVAGVNYAVGPQSTPTGNPATISMSGVSVNTQTHVITVSGSNVTLSGYDFSLNGGWQIDVASGANNLTITNNYFKVGANGLQPIVAATGAGNITLEYNTIDGGGLGVGGNQPDILFTAGQGATVEYNYFLNAPQDGMNFYQTGNYTVMYNLFSTGSFYSSAHADWIQTYSYAGGTIQSLTVEYNTVYQPAANASGWPGTMNSFVRIGDEAGTAVQSSPGLQYNNRLGGDGSRT